MGGHNLSRGIGLILALLSESGGLEERGGDLLLFTCYNIALNSLTYSHVACITKKRKKLSVCCARTKPTANGILVEISTHI